MADFTVNSGSSGIGIRSHAWRGAADDFTQQGSFPTAPVWTITSPTDGSLGTLTPMFADKTKANFVPLKNARGVAVCQETGTDENGSPVVKVFTVEVVWEPNPTTHYSLTQEAVS